MKIKKLNLKLFLNVSASLLIAMPVFALCPNHEDRLVCFANWEGNVALELSLKQSPGQSSFKNVSLNNAQNAATQTVLMLGATTQGSNSTAIYVDSTDQCHLELAVSPSYSDWEPLNYSGAIDLPKSRQQRQSSSAMAQPNPLVWYNQFDPSGLNFVIQFSYRSPEVERDILLVRFQEEVQLVIKWPEGSGISDNLLSCIDKSHFIDAHSLQYPNPPENWIQFKGQKHKIITSQDVNYELPKQKYSCSRQGCVDSFHSRAARRAHVKKIHNCSRSLSCPFCSLPYGRTETILGQHIRNAHSNQFYAWTQQNKLSSTTSANTSSP